MNTDHTAHLKPSDLGGKTEHFCYEDDDLEEEIRTKWEPRILQAIEEELDSQMEVEENNVREDEALNDYPADEYEIESELAELRQHLYEEVSELIRHEYEPVIEQEIEELEQAEYED
jgi:hypothetical protein